MRKTLIYILLAAMLGAAGCKPDGSDVPPTNRVTIMYAAAFSNLSAAITEDINEMCAGMLPTLSSTDVFVVYSHTRPTEADPNQCPVLFRAWRDPSGTAHRDTLKVYPQSDISSSPDVMHKVLTDIKDLYPAPHYGLMISSHGLGWLPRGYVESTDHSTTFSTSTKELCIESIAGSGIDIDRLPGAIPMKLDYILMDTCLMGCVEVAYELRDKCDKLLFSPTEILSDGMVYTTMAALLTNVATPSLKTIAKEYFDHYQSQTGLYQSATITLVDCTKLVALADVCKSLTSTYRTQIEGLDPDSVQAYFYNESTHFFFDLKDIYVQAGATGEEIAALDAALKDAVIYYAATDNFFNLRLERVCGLSMYLPYASHKKLNKFYKELSWNKSIGLIL